MLWCVKYHVLLDRVITAPEWLYLEMTSVSVQRSKFVLKRLSSWSISFSELLHCDKLQTQWWIEYVLVTLASDVCD